jgi:hypothetical protein
MLFPNVSELSITGVAYPGVANEERIVLRPTQLVNLAEFGILLGQPSPDGMATPYIDNFFWFGEISIAPPSWVFVYTGPGEWQNTRVPETGENAYVMHWGKNTTVFGAGANVVPVVVRIGAVLVGGPALPTPAPISRRPLITPRNR